MTLKDCLVVFATLYVRANQKGRRADIEIISECLVLLGLPIKTKNLKCDLLVLVIFRTVILLRFFFRELAIGRLPVN